MSEITIRHYNIKEKLFLSLIGLILVFLPIKVQVTTIFVIPLSLVWLWSSQKNGFFAKIFENRFYLIISPLIFLYVFSLVLYLDRPNVMQLEKRAALLLFPLFIGSTSLLNKKNIILLFKVFSYTMALVCVYALIKMTLFRLSHDYIAPIGEGPWVVKYVLMHRPYFGLFSVLAIILSSTLVKWKSEKFYLGLLVIAVNTAVLFLIVAKMAILSLLLFAAYKIFVFITKGKLLFGLTILLIFTGGLVLNYNLNVHFKKRINKELMNKQRLVIWNCAFEQCKTADFNLFYGFASDVEFQKRVNSCLKNKGSKDFNSHNQYLSFYGGHGIMGIALFLSIIATLLYSGFKTGNELLILFLALFMLQCVTENILSRQWGIFLFSIFVPLFIKMKKPY